jgi:hypothetical protein
MTWTAAAIPTVPDADGYRGEQTAAWAAPNAARMSSTGWREDGGSDQQCRGHRAVYAIPPTSTNGASCVIDAMATAGV